MKRAEIPATYEGFTDPKWKGRIGLEATDAEWMATLIKTSPGDKGMDLMRRLSALRPALRTGARAARLAGCGRRGAGGPCDGQQQHRDAEAQGRADRLRPVQPVVARPQGIGVARNAPHPNAALLFADYVLSPEGQKLFESMGRVPASTKVKSAFNNFPFTVIDPVTVIDESAKWDKVWNDLFVKR